jgi:TonB family protein
MIKASFILIAALCINAFLRKRAAAERHLVFTAAILSAALLPMLSAVLPSWQPDVAQQIMRALPRVSERNSNPSVRSSDFVFHADGIEPSAGSLDQFIRFVWIAGISANLFFFAMGIRKQHRAAVRNRSLSGTPLAQMTAQLASRMGCKRTIHLSQSADSTMPKTWGILRPQISLPNSAGLWPEERTRVVIAHELAHVRRLDWLWQMAARLACAVYWFNPLFWIACNRLYRDAEIACDDAVINLNIDPKEYASHLLEIAKTLRQSSTVWAATLAMAQRSTLEKRFAALLDSNANRRVAVRTTLLLTAAATLFVVLPLAAMHLSNSPVRRNVDIVAPHVDQYTTPPLYSDEARMLRIEGVVTVEATIDSDGSVKRLRVVKGLGHGLDQNALLAVRDWRFIPARQHGIAVEARTLIEVEFSLRNAELNELIANDMATRIGPGVLPPQIVHRVEPSYSVKSPQSKPDGAVVLDAVILEDGTAKIVRVIRSLDWELDEVAINALKQWRFSPAIKEGVPVRVRMNIAVNL